MTSAPDTLISASILEADFRALGQPWSAGHSGAGGLAPCVGFGAVAEVAGHGGSSGERECGVRLGDAYEHLVEHPSVGEQFLSETVVIGPVMASPFG